MCYYRESIIIYPPENRAPLQWLDRKVKLLAKELKHVEKVKSVQILIESLDELETVLTPEGRLTQERIQVVREKLVKEALSDAQGPEFYVAKVNEVLFERVCNQFSSEIKHNPVVRSIFQEQLLVQINAKLTKQQLTIQNFADSLSASKHLKDTVQQVSISKVGNPPAKTQESHKTSENRVRITLEIPIDQLNTPQVAALIEQLRQL